AAPGQAVGTGCVYPVGVPTIANQLAGRGFTWKGYMQDMDASTTQPTCRHPAIDSVDNTQAARVGDQYAARHNPFVYFHSIIDSPACAVRVVGLSRLPRDLQKVSTTPNLSYITPNLCNDGHDAPCVDGRPGGLVSSDAWLKLWIPKILASPAFRQDGLLIVTFDEAELTGSNADSSVVLRRGSGTELAAPRDHGSRRRTRRRDSGLPMDAPRPGQRDRLQPLRPLENHRRSLRRGSPRLRELSRRSQLRSRRLRRDLDVDRGNAVRSSAPRVMAGGSRPDTSHPALGGEISGQTSTVTRRKVAVIDVVSSFALWFCSLNRAASSRCRSSARPFISAASNAFIVGP
ncbi:MAG: phosphatidylinositol-3-phosphatase, partial [Actinomycetota bacterium]|nr:phosphatidylinositol-3-phosphatase [Actinomycetota bacterium]